MSRRHRGHHGPPQVQSSWTGKSFRYVRDDAIARVIEREWGTKEIDASAQLFVWAYLPSELAKQVAEYNRDKLREAEQQLHIEDTHWNDPVKRAEAADVVWHLQKYPLRCEFQLPRDASSTIVVSVVGARGEFPEREERVVSFSHHGVEVKWQCSGLRDGERCLPPNTRSPANVDEARTIAVGLASAAIKLVSTWPKAEATRASGTVRVVR